MQIRRPHSSEILNRVVPPLTALLITRILGSDKVSDVVDRVDRRIERRASRSLARAQRNAAANPVLLFGGMIAVVAGIAMIAKAVSTRK